MFHIITQANYVSDNRMHSMTLCAEYRSSHAMIAVTLNCPSFIDANKVIQIEMALI